MTVDRSFSGKGVLITGGTSGIGLACARRFAGAGARVAVTYHSDSVVAERVANELGGPDRVMTIRSDASQYADAARPAWHDYALRPAASARPARAVRALAKSLAPVLTAMSLFPGAGLVSPTVTGCSRGRALARCEMGSLSSFSSRRSAI